jgi:hypothetical protein
MCKRSFSLSQIHANHLAPRWLPPQSLSVSVTMQIPPVHVPDPPRGNIAINNNIISSVSLEYINEVFRRYCEESSLQAWLEGK